MNLNLKEFRGKYKISRKQFAIRMKMSIDDVKKLEEYLEHDEKFICDIYKEFDIVTNNSNDENSIHIDNLTIWDEIKKISYDIKNEIKSLKGRKLQLNLINNSILELEEYINALNKPIVSVLGMSDTGKSNLINYLTENNKMPQSWNPTTSITVYIKHIKDKPSFVKKDVCLYKCDTKKEKVNPKKVNNKDYHENLLISECNSDELKEFATRECKNSDIDSAVIYLDSKILEYCDLVDLPGFGTGENQKEDNAAIKISEYADVIIYLSIANGFLRIHDLEFLKHSLKTLPIIENKYINEFKPLCNIFILASHAHVINYGDIKQVNNILDRGGKLLYTQMADEIWTLKSEVSKYKYTYQDIRNRFYSFTTDMKVLREKFENEFLFFLRTYAVETKKNMLKSLKDLLDDKKKVLSSELDTRKRYLQDKKYIEDEFNYLLNNEESRISNNKQNKEKILKQIKQLQYSTIDEFTERYNNIVNDKYIITIIKRNGYKKNQEDIELLSSFINEKLNGAATVIINEKNKKIGNILEDYIKDFDTSINISGKPSNIMIAFKAKKALTSVITGMATFGTLGVLASFCGNLGGYILIAKGVSVLSSLGISFAATNGTAGVMSAVAAIGGPVTIGIAFASLVGICWYNISSIGWQKKVASKIKEWYDSENIRGVIIDNLICSYWNELTETFINLTSQMENEFNIYFNDLKKRTENFDYVKENILIKEIEVVIESINDMITLVDKEILNEIELVKVIII